MGRVSRSFRRGLLSSGWASCTLLVCSVMWLVFSLSLYLEISTKTIYTLLLSAVMRPVSSAIVYIEISV